MKENMKLTIEKRKEGDHYFYYLPLHQRKVARTHSIENAVGFGNADHELMYVEVATLPPAISEQVKSLSKSYDQFELLGEGFRLRLSEKKSSNETVCMVNIDLDVNGNIVGIEIV